MILLPICCRWLFPISLSRAISDSFPEVKNCCCHFFGTENCWGSLKFAENICSCLWLLQTPPPGRYTATCRACHSSVDTSGSCNWRVSTYHIRLIPLEEVFLRMKCYNLKPWMSMKQSICQFSILGGFWHALIMVYVVRLITTGAWSCPSFHDWVFSSCHKLLVFNFHCWWKASLKELWHGIFSMDYHIPYHSCMVYLPTFGWLGDGFKDFLFLKTPWGNDPIRQPRDLKWIGSTTNYIDGIAWKPPRKTENMAPEKNCSP